MLADYLLPITKRQNYTLECDLVSLELAFYPLSLVPKMASPQNTANQSVNQPEPAFGWTPYAELINGRFAMIGFVALLILELVTRQDFFTWLGL
jgi:Chlorophyll A-B binding protein